jgi:hypothetical protein
LPYDIRPEPGTEHLKDGIYGYFYDGGVMETMPYTSPLDNEFCIRVSAQGLKRGDIRNSASPPFAWAVFPPNRETLLEMVNLGYSNAEVYFSRHHIDFLESIRKETSIPRNLSFSVVKLQGEHHERKIAEVHPANRQFGRRFLGGLSLFIIFFVRLIVVQKWLVLLLIASQLSVQRLRAVIQFVRKLLIKLLIADAAV